MFPELITELLQEGHKVNFCAPGHSMFPTIMANESIIVAPVDPNSVRLRDIILYRTNGQLIAHRVVSIKKEINDAFKVSKNSNKLQSNLFIKGKSPLFKRSALQAQRSLNKVLLQAQRSSNEVLLQAERSSNEVLLQAERSSSAALYFILRGDASATCDKPVTPAQILGKVISIERYGHHVNPYSFRHRAQCYGLTWLARFKRLLRLFFSIFLQYDR